MTMRVSVVRPADLGPAEAARWTEFQRLSPVHGSPFLSLPFARAVGRARPGARVAVVEVDGSIEAFLPFELGPWRMGLPVGTPMNDLHGFLSSGTQLDARRVIMKAGLRGWRFISAPAEQAALAPYHYGGTVVACPVVDLTAGFAAYQASRKRALIAETRRKARVLEREHGPVCLTWNTASESDIRQLIAWKAAKYGGTRELFADPSAQAIITELAAAAGEDCQGIVTMLTAGGKPVAVGCSLRAGTGLSGWFTAYEPALSRLSPGVILIFGLFEEAARQGITRIDLGYGQDSYKHGLANDSYPVAGGAVWASQAERLARSVYRRVRA
jgi:CelD/BcsL family acetyltransferase involved in cellulose biosynthesis